MDVRARRVRLAPLPSRSERFAHGAVSERVLCYRLPAKLIRDGLSLCLLEYSCEVAYIGAFHLISFVLQGPQGSQVPRARACEGRGCRGGF